MFSLGVMTLFLKEPERDPIEDFDEIDPGVFHLSFLWDDSEILDESTSTDDWNCFSLPPVLRYSCPILIEDVPFWDEEEEIRFVELEDLPGL